MKRDRRRGRVQSGEGWAMVANDSDDVGGEDRVAPLARLRLEQRRGKPVTVASLEGLDETRLRTLGKELKTLCGVGGTVKTGVLELQGDHRETLRRVLGERGVRVKG